MEKKFKEMENSELLIRVIQKEYVDELGRKVVETKWFKANGEVNLGSSANPNKEIIGFKYNVPDDKPLFKKLFGD